MARPSLPFVALVFVALAGATGATVLAACEDAQTYVYSAQKYDPVADCLSPYAPVELVSGSGASSTCPALCLTVGADLLVSTMCPPLPLVATAVDADAGPCLAALAAAARGGTCDEPGEAGAPEEDAGDPDATADPDATTDPDASEPEDAAPDAAVPVKDAGDAG